MCAPLNLEWRVLLDPNGVCRWNWNGCIVKFQWVCRWILNVCNGVWLTCGRGGLSAVGTTLLQSPGCNEGKARNETLGTQIQNKDWAPKERHYPRPLSTRIRICMYIRTAQLLCLVVSPLHGSSRISSNLASVRLSYTTKNNWNFFWALYLIHIVGIVINSDSPH